MTINKITLKDGSILTQLLPDEGKHLTNGEIYAEKEIYLGKNDSPDNWSEITDEEYEKILAEMTLDELEEEISE